MASQEEQSLTIVDAKQYRRVETILLMGPPRDVAVTTDGRYALIASAEPNADEVVVFDLLGRQNAGAIRVGPQPWSILAEPTGQFAFVTNSGANSVSVIDLSQHREVTRIPVGREPKEMAFAKREDGLLYVVNAGDNTISAVDPKAHRVLGTIAVGQKPVAVAITPNGQSIYVANSGDHTISVVNANQRQVTTTIKLDGLPSSLRVSPDGRFLYATLQTGEQEATREPAPTPTAIAGSARYDAVVFGPDRGFRLSRGMVAVIDSSLNQVVGQVAVSQKPNGIVFSEDGRRAFVTGAQDSLVTVIDVDTRQVLSSIEVGAGPIAITAFDRPRFIPTPEPRQAVGSRQ